MVDHARRNLIGVREPMQLLKELQQHHQAQTRSRQSSGFCSELDLFFAWCEMNGQLVRRKWFGQPRINSLFVERHSPPPCRGRRFRKSIFQSLPRNRSTPANLVVLVGNAELFSRL